MPVLTISPDYKVERTILLRSGLKPAAISKIYTPSLTGFYFHHEDHTGWRCIPQAGAGQATQRRKRTKLGTAEVCTNPSTALNPSSFTKFRISQDTRFAIVRFLLGPNDRIHVIGDANESDQ